MNGHGKKAYVPPQKNYHDQQIPPEYRVRERDRIVYNDKAFARKPVDYVYGAFYIGKALGKGAVSLLSAGKDKAISRLKAARKPTDPQKKKVDTASSSSSTVRKKQEVASSSSTSAKKKVSIVADLSPYIVVYDNKTAERLFESPYTAPSENDRKVCSRDVTINSSNNLMVRVYIPAKTLDSGEKIPILVYYHGGGFCLDSAFSEASHGYLNQLVEISNVIAISVDYRLAPENPLPAAFDDSWEALQWVASHQSHVLEQKKPEAPGAVEMAKGLYNYAVGKGATENPSPNLKERWLESHGDFSKLFVGGDSAGGTIAHYLSLKARPGPNGLGDVKILGTILCFPYFIDKRTDKKNMAFQMWKMAYPECSDWVDNLYINPFPSGPSNNHPFQFDRMFVCYGGEMDEHRDITKRFADAMRREKMFSGEVKEIPVRGEKHCFHLFDPTTKNAQTLIGHISSFIKAG